ITIEEDHILNVPDEYETIQGAIDRTSDGDTVLVDPGEYVENINFLGKDIVVIGNPDDPSEVVIDGDENGSVVTIRDVDSEEAALVGFTIQNGDADHYGGGIICSNSNLTISNCIINGNSAVDNNDEGGGMYCSSNSNPTLRNLIISNNTATYGGGISCYRSNPTLIDVIINNNTAGWGGGIDFQHSDATLVDVIICENSAEQWGGGVRMRYSSPEMTRVTIYENSVDRAGGGGISCSYESNPNIMNCTISNNSADIGGGVHSGYNSNPRLINTIVWNNTPNAMGLYHQGDPSSIEIFYSDIEGGQDGIETNDNGEVEWGEGNIDTDPLFADPDEGDYHLTWENYPAYDDTRSPCIDAGDPDSDNDPDDTRADMGAYYFNYEPVPDITVEPDAIDYGDISYTATAEEMLTISNHGSEDLRVTDISIAGDGFSVNFVNEFVLGPDQSREFRVTFDTNDEAGEFEADLVIASDDPDEDEVTVHLSGTAVNHPPEWTQEQDDVIADEGDLIQFTIAGEDFDNDELTIEMENAPDVELTLEPDISDIIAYFEWQTDHEDAGDYAINFIISDGTNEIETDVNITINNVNQPPEVVNPIDSLVIDEDSGEHRVADLNEVFEDPDEDEMTFDVSGIDELNLSLDGQDILTLEPDPDYYGVSEVTVTADDGQEERDSGPVRGLRITSRVSIPVGESIGVANLASRQLRTSKLVHSGSESADNLSRHFGIPVRRSDSRRDAQAECTFTVTVINVNDPPRWVEYPQEPIEVDAGERIQFTMLTEDIDNEMLNIAWDGGDLPGEATLDIADDGSRADFDWQTSRDDVGEYLPIFTVSDGEDDHEVEVSITVNPSRVPQHFTEFDTTGASHHLRITALGLYESDAETGWEVGIFTEEGLLAGAGVWIEDEILVLEAWADDPETGETDGFRNNEAFDFRIWEPDEDQEYDGVAWFEDGPETWEEDAVSTLSLDAFVPGETVVSFVQGWNYISINVYPGPDMYEENQGDGPDIIIMTGQLRAENHHRIVQMKDDHGNVYIPAHDNFNNIPFWSPIDAYQVEIDETIETTWTGAKIPYNTNIPLNDVWNLVPYYPDYELDAGAPDFYVLSDIIESVVFAKDDNGNFLVTRYEYSEMPPWQAGKGYYINISEDVILNYPAEQEREAAVHRPRKGDNADRHWIFTPQSGINMSLLLTSIGDDIASDGDEVAVFGASGRLAGAGIVSDGKCGISVWGDNTETEMQEGLIEGEAFELKLWTTQSGVESSLRLRAILHGDQLSYSDDELLVIEVALSPETPKTFALSGAYPNPFNAVIRLTYTIPEESFVKLAVYDLRGNEVELLTNGKRSAGYYS
ncbi:MAG: choice-of-anchor D domain-containing protein, partial [Calditrichaeota bacterium]|nr:choice-of-anchor D domain-containing protein [Calditrichota bacterium]